MKTTRADITSATAVQFIELMYALAVQNIPKGEEWLYEVKFDGYHWLAGRNSSKVTHRPIAIAEARGWIKKIPPVYHAIELPEIRIVFVSFKVPGSIASIRSNGRNKSA